MRYGRIELIKTANGETPLVHGATPILGCDVREHSYYIDNLTRAPIISRRSSITGHWD
ncbi:MAG: Fe-Mn family superoxide dismutase [Xanthobacteraceae bacterium]